MVPIMLWAFRDIMFSERSYLNLPIMESHNGKAVKTAARKKIWRSCAPSSGHGLKNRTIHHVLANPGVGDAST
jgi:hypothetical protein